MQTVTKRRILLILVPLAILGQAGCTPTRQSSLEPATPEEVGLHWEECAAPHGFEPYLEETCFGHPGLRRSEADIANFATQVGSATLELTIGQDVYEASLTSHSFQQETYTLHRNGQALRSLNGQFTGYSPNVSLQNVGGKAVWEFSDAETSTIIYDGLDIRELYGVNKAYRPYGLDGKLIFVGQGDGQYFVVYDGRKVGSGFDWVFIAYCCESAMWSIHYGQGKYLFWGSRGGQWYVVEITLASDGG